MDGISQWIAAVGSCHRFDCGGEAEAVKTQRTIKRSGRHTMSKRGGRSRAPTSQSAV